MRLVTAATLAAMAAAPAAIAQSQLEMNIGAIPGDLTLAQQIQLKKAQDDDDWRRLSFLLRQEGVVLSTQSIGAKPYSGKTQLAAHMGVDENDYTTAELVKKWFD